MIFLLNLKKNNTIRRFCAIFLCVFMLICIMPTHMGAVSGKSGNLTWSLSGGLLSISGSGSMPNYTDAKMAPWYDSAGAITRVVIREGVTSIGDLAFYGCTKLSNCSIATTVQSIGDRAFKNCGSLKHLTLPDGLLSIGDAAFESCKSLKSITLPDGLKKLGDYAFDLCASLASITIPSSATDIGMAVFADCAGLTQVTMLSQTSKLPDWTFYGCSSLNWVTISEEVSEIGNEAFNNCSSLDVVYYAGDSDAVEKAIASNPSTTMTRVSAEEIPEEGFNSSGTVSDWNTGSTTTTAVTQTSGASIIQTTTKDYTYTIDGSSASFQEALSASETATVKVSETATVSLDATIKDSEGWNDLADKIEDIEKSYKEQVKVDVYVDTSNVSGEGLSELAGKNAAVTITTDNGSKVIIDTSDKSAKDFSKDQYNFEVEIEKMEDNNTSIESDTVYQVNFNGSLDFDAQIGIHVKTGNAYQYATLYEKTLFKTVEVQTALVDEDGIAWFNLESVNKNVTCYVGIDAKGVDTSKAIIPDTLAEEYGIDENTLTDASGTKYAITGRSSRWGITGGQFALYVAIGVAILIAIVTTVMLTLNKLKRIKMKYALAGVEADKIDEEALRLEVLKDLLNEANKNKK